MCLYLDMNIWVDMARGIRDRSPKWEEVVDGLRAGVADGTLVVPLSANHYLELWHRSDQKSREGVGALMREISGYMSLKPIQMIRQLEVDASVERMIGYEGRVIPKGEIVGYGVAHAFGSKFGRLRFVESLETPDSPEGSATSAPEQLCQFNLSGPRWEWLQLVGTQEILESEGVDRSPEHLHGDRYVDQELALRVELERDPSRRLHLADIIVTQEIIDLTDQIHRSCSARNVDPLGLFLEHSEGVDPPEAMRRFVSGLPSVDVLTTLRTWKHRDLTHPWEQHDKVDLMALTVAVPYCDVVVTERRWSHLVNASGLASRNNTFVGHGVAALQTVLRGQND